MKTIDLIGNVGRDAKQTTTANGKDIMRFSLGVTNRDGSTTWISVVATYRPNLVNYIVKGRQLFVRGDFDARVYNDEVEINCYADKIELIGKKCENETVISTELVQTPNEPNAQVVATDI